MTQQVPEYLTVDGRTVCLGLAPRLPEQDPRIVRRDPMEGGWLWSSACWRGYQGYWEISSGHLYLVRLEGQWKMAGPDPILADWFTGPILLSDLSASYRIEKGRVVEGTGRTSDRTAVAQAPCDQSQEEGAASDARSQLFDGVWVGYLEDLGLVVFDPSIQNLFRNTPEGREVCLWVAETHKRAYREVQRCRNDLRRYLGTLSDDERRVAAKEYLAWKCGVAGVPSGMTYEAWVAEINRRLNDISVQNEEELQRLREANRRDV